MKARHKLLRQSGLSLIELIGALAIGSVMLLGLVHMIDSSLEDMKGQQASAYQVQLTNAVRNYISANYAKLTSTTDVDRVPVGSTIAVDIGKLIAGNFLPLGFSPTNAYQQQGCALIRQPTAGQLDTLVVTTGGMPIEDRNIVAVAANAGMGSGYINSTDTANATGASWKLSTSNYSSVICAGGTKLTGTSTDAGHLVSRVFQGGGATADFLYRDDVGVPALNTMNTPVLLANNAIVTEGQACSTPGVAADASGSLLQCVGWQWVYVSKWKAPVESYNALYALADQNRGDVRMVMGSGSGTVNKAFVYDGSNWQPLAEDQNGNLTVKNNVAAGGTLTVAGGAAIGGHTEITNSLHTTQHISTDQDVNATGNAFIAGYVMVGDRATIDDLIKKRTANTGAKAGDVWAANDLQASQEMHGGWVISDSSITAESVFMSYQKAHMAGAGCNFAYTDTGVRIVDRYNNPYTVWPVGTIAAEGGVIQNADGSGLDKVWGQPNGGTGKLLYCGTDNQWHYVSPPPP